LRCGNLSLILEGDGYALRSVGDIRNRDSETKQALPDQGTIASGFAKGISFCLDQKVSSDGMQDCRMQPSASQMVETNLHRQRNSFSPVIEMMQEIIP